MSGHHKIDGTAVRARLQIAFAATLLLAAVEAAGGFAAHSLALLSDAAHVIMDVVALGIALLALVQSSRPADERRTYGFARFEVLAALANGALLVGVTVLIVIEAIHRFAVPEHPEGGLMVAVASFGFVLNVGIGVMLLRGGGRTLNVRAALMHVAGDALGAIAVVIGGAVILRTGYDAIDPALSLLVSAIILVGIINIFRDATDVLLESTPAHVTIAEVRQHMRDCEDVVDVHDLHVWTIGAENHVLSAHVIVEDRRVSEATAVLERIKSAMHDDFGIEHVTLQIECQNCEDQHRVVATPAASSRGALS